MRLENPELTRLRKVCRGLLLVVLAVVPVARGQWTQHAKLAGSGAAGSGGQGCGVALSADGQTALVGGPYDNQSLGAAWVFTRNGNIWIEQAKLVSPDAVGAAMEGFSVALSADGNTALIGGPGDDNGRGAAWVWQRSGVLWIRQAKLVGSGMFRDGSALQGFSVALSASGDMAIVGGPKAYTGEGVPPGAFSGSVWVWTRNADGIWSQVDTEIGGSRAVPWAVGLRGASVALSGDGNTALVGGGRDVLLGPLLGTAWVWTRNYGVWTEKQQLAGAGYVNVSGEPGINLEQALHVAVSADGNTAVAGGAEDDNLTGAAWIWTRRRDEWLQQGPKLAAAGIAGARQGASVALSQDGNTAILGGPSADNGVGAAWLWMRRNGVWIEGPKLVGTLAAGAAAQGWSVALSARGGRRSSGDLPTTGARARCGSSSCPGLIPPGKGVRRGDRAS